MTNCYTVKESKPISTPKQPKINVIQNILNFSKSLEIHKTKTKQSVEIVLN